MAPRLSPGEGGPTTDLSSFFDYPQGSNDEQRGSEVFLADRSEGDWAKLIAHTETHRFRRGDEVIREGAVERALYILVSGDLEVLVSGHGGKSYHLASIVPGSVLGEQAFLDGLPRSATIKATSEGEMFRLSLEAFEVLAAREPELARSILFDLGRIISIRLRRNTAIIAQLVR